MKELRKLLAKGSQGKWHSLAKWTEICDDNDNTVCNTITQEDADLIAAMHNALPELLDAWETLEALRWANDLRMNGTCDLCPFYDDDVNVWKRGCDRQCRALFEFEGEWQKVWRDAHADTNAD